MPVDYRLYPADWKTAIRPRILDREQHRCKFCLVLNGADLPAKCCAEPIFDERRICCSCGKRRPRVVLTIAHLDHDIKNNSDANLAALCQRCHLRHDQQQHAKSRALSKARRSPQLCLAL